MRKIIFLLFIFSFIITGVVQAKDLSLEYKNKIFVDNNYYPIWRIFKENYVALSTDITGSVQFMQDREESEIVSISDYFIGYIKEYEEWGEANEETTIFLVEELQNDQHTKRKYNLDLNTFEQVVEGLVFGSKVFSDDDYKVDLVLEGKLLKGLELTQRSYAGAINKIDDKYYMSGTEKGIYSKLTDETEMYDVNFNSYGYSLGYNINWRLSPKFNLQLEAENFYSKIKWEDVYTLDMNLNDRSLGMYSSLDNSLSTKGNSTSYTQGRYSYEDYTTQLRPEYNLVLQGPNSRFGLFYRKKLYPYFNFILLDGPVVIKPGAYRDFFTCELSYRALNIKFMSKKLDIFNSSGIGIQLSLKRDF